MALLLMRQGGSQALIFEGGGSVSSISVQQCEAPTKPQCGADTAGEDGSCCDSLKQEIKRGIIK